MDVGLLAAALAGVAGGLATWGVHSLCGSGPAAAPVRAAGRGALALVGAVARSGAGRRLAGLRTALGGRSLDRALARHAPDLARGLAGALKAGLTLPQGIARLAREAAPPAGPLLAQLELELGLGTPLAVALDGLLARTNCLELRLLVTAVQVGRVTGGDLAGALEGLALALAERQRAEREVAAATAEARAVAGLVPVLPLAGAALLSLAMPGFTSVLLRPAGLLLLAAFAAWLALGWLAIRALAQVRV